MKKFSIVSIITMLGIFVILSSLPGCLTLNIPKLGGGKVLQTSQNYESEEYRDEDIIIYDGRAKKVTDYYRRIAKSKQKIIPKKTLMERVGGWISGLSFLTFILIIAGLFLAPTTTISILWSLKRRLARAFKETVAAIKCAQAVNKDKKLHDALSSIQSTTTKKLVGKIKAGM